MDQFGITHNLVVVSKIFYDENVDTLNYSVPSKDGLVSILGDGNTGFHTNEEIICQWVWLAARSYIETHGLSTDPSGFSVIAERILLILRNHDILKKHSVLDDKELLPSVLMIHGFFYHRA